MRDRRVARVIDREIAPIWHDRFARLIVRNLPTSSDVIALDIHCGVGRMTAELLSRMGASARVLAIEPDDTLIDFARTKMRPEWKNRVYLKPGNFDDVTAMADDSYNLVVANLVLGDAGDIGSALAEMIRVNRIGGRILATLPLAGSWHEVEDIFAEVLRDAGLTAAVRRLERLRELRPTGPQLSQIVRGLGVAEDDFVIEQERFQLLFPSGREFLFAPVVEHGPLRLWKAVIGKDGSPQELFWRLKEAIDTYYTGHVLAVNVSAGLMNIHVAKGTESPGPRLAARYWRHYPTLDALWGGLAAGYVRVSEPSLPPFGDADFDFDLEIDEGEARRTGAQKPVTTSIPIVTDDLYDDAIGAAPEPAAEPSRPAARQVAGAGRTSAEPARPMATLQAANTSARLQRPPVAEDDFSDINESFEPSKSFRRQDLRNSFSDTQNDDEREPPAQQVDEVEEPADPTSPFRLEELRAAAAPREEPEDDPEEIEDAEEVEDSGDPDEPDEPEAEEADEPAADESEADESEANEPEADEPAADEADEPEAGEPASEIAAEPASVVEPVRPLSGIRPQDSGTFRSSLHDSNITRRPAGDAATSPTFRPPSESGTFRAPSSESSGLTPRFSGESSGVTPRSALHDSGLRRPSSESSGVTPRPSSESSGATPRSSLHDSGLRRPSSESSGVTPRPSSESSGITPRPSSESSGATPRSSLHDSGIRRPSSESSGITPRPSSESSGLTPRSSLNDSGIRRPSSESSGVTQRPGSETSGVNPLLLRPAAAEPVTGSFKVFAPPKPRLSPETGPRDVDPYASDLSSLASEPVGDVPEIGPRTASRDAPAAPARSPSRDAPVASTRTASRDAPAAPVRTPSSDAPAAPARTPSRDVPAAPPAPIKPILAKPQVADSSPEDEEELDELDELDEAEELEEEDDAPPPTTRGGPPPPRPKAPPPPPSGLFKPRALLPIVAPPKKK